MRLVAALLLGLEARAAVHRAISAGLERNLRGLAAAVADHIVHLTIAATGAAAAVGLTTLSAARRATTGLILEALVGVELLLGRGEYELCAALAAGDGLVFEHGKKPS